MRTICVFDKIMDKVNKNLRSIEKSLAKIEKTMQIELKKFRDYDGKNK